MTGRPVVARRLRAGCRRACSSQARGDCPVAARKSPLKREADKPQAAAAAVNSDYRRHSRAAGEIAREYFEAEKVLASLLDRAGV